MMVMAAVFAVCIPGAHGRDVTAENVGFRDALVGEEAIGSLGARQSWQANGMPPPMPSLICFNNSAIRRTGLPVITRSGGIGQARPRNCVDTQIRFWRSYYDKAG
jgi:hypothetical protein